MRRARPLPWLLLGLILGGLGGWGASTLARPPLVPGQDAVYAGRPAGGVWEDGVLRVPAHGRAHTLLVLYPGGLVRPQAYEWLGAALAPQGVETVIAGFPLDLAVLSPGRAGDIVARYGAGRRVVLAGHSLGGAMAARHALRHPEGLDGLILMAAYPARSDDLSGLNLPTLSLMAERDRVAIAADVRGGLARLPQGTRLEVIGGAVHSFFGRYGPQRGDGIPAVSRAEAEEEIVAALRGFLAPPAPP